MKRILNILVLMPVMFVSVGCGSTANTSDSAAIVDTTKPVITVSKKELSVAVGDEEWSKSVAKNFKVVDDTDGNLKEVEKVEDGKAGYVVDDDKVDPTKAGTYTVSVTAVDSSGNTAKSSFSVKVTEGKEEAETETESKSESSSSNSSATNSSSASNSSANKNTGSSSGSSTSSSNSGSSGSAAKPSTGSGTTSSGSTSKPSTGSSTSSGSSTASKPSTGSGSSSNSGGSTTKPACKDVVVVDREAYDEQVLVKEAWDETVVTKATWSEVVVVEPEREVTVCRCGAQFENGEDWLRHALDNDCGGYYVDWIPAKTTVVNHPAETTTVHHDAEYKTVHHEAVTHVEHVCS